MLRKSSPDDWERTVMKLILAGPAPRGVTVATRAVVAAASVSLPGSKPGDYRAEFDTSPG
jgi:hypothetical protein